MPDRLELLEQFFKAVANLTLNHKVVYSRVDENVDGSAVVYPSDLGAALEKVDPEWWKHA